MQKCYIINSRVILHADHLLFQNFIATTFDTPGSSDHDVGGPDGDVLKLQSGKAYFNLTEVGSNEMCLVSCLD